MFWFRSVLPVLFLLFSQFWQSASGFTDLLFPLFNPGQGIGLPEHSAALGREPDDNPPGLLMTGDFVTKLWLPNLYHKVVLQKHRLLKLLRQRARQAAASGQRDLAVILRNRIMVIGADLSTLVSGQLGSLAFLLEELLKELLGNHEELQAYEAAPLAEQRKVQQQDHGRQVPGREKEATSQPKSKPATRKQPERAIVKSSGPLPQRTQSGDDDPTPDPLNHSYSNTFCPLCNYRYCRKREPDSEVEVEPDAGDSTNIQCLPPLLLMIIFRYTTLKERNGIMRCCRVFNDAASPVYVLSDQVLNQYKGQDQLLYLRTPVGAHLLAAIKNRTGYDLASAQPGVQHLLARFLGLEPLTIPCHASVSCIATLPDDRVVSGFNDGTMGVWTLQGKLDFCRTDFLRVHTEEVSCIEVLPSGNRVLTGSGNIIKVWDLSESGIAYCTHTLEGHWHGFRIWCIKAWSDVKVLSGSSDHRVRVWEIGDNGEYDTYELLIHRNTITAIEIMPNDHMYALSYDGLVVVWDLKQLPAHAYNVYALPLPEHTWEGNTYGLVVLPDNRLITYNFVNIDIWELAGNGEAYRLFSKSVYDGMTCMKILPNGYVVSSSYDNLVRVWHINRSGEISCLQTLQGHDNIAWCVALFRGIGLVSGSEDKTIKVWEYPE